MAVIQKVHTIDCAKQQSVHPSLTDIGCKLAIHKLHRLFFVRVQINVL